MPGGRAARTLVLSPTGGQNAAREHPPTLAHPYQALSSRTLRAATVGTAIAWGFLTLLILWVVPIEHGAELQRLLQVADPDAQRAVLQSWTPDVRASLSFLVGFDFLYDLVHNNAAAFFAIWGARRCASRLAGSLAGSTAWILWLDSALNVPENLAFVHVLRSGSTGPLLRSASAVFSFRSATLLLGLMIGASLHAVAWRAGRDVRG